MQTHTREEERYGVGKKGGWVVIGGVGEVEKKKVEREECFRHGPSPASTHWKLVFDLLEVQLSTTLRAGLEICWCLDHQTVVVSPSNT